jgi:hypothetical protein
MVLAGAGPGQAGHSFTRAAWRRCGSSDMIARLPSGLGWRGPPKLVMAVPVIVT